MKKPKRTTPRDEPSDKPKRDRRLGLAAERQVRASVRSSPHDDPPIATDEPSEGEEFSHRLSRLSALGAPVDSFLLDALRDEKAVRAFALKKGFLPGTEPCYFTFELARFLRPHLPELLRRGFLFAPSILYALRFARVSQAPDMKRLRRRIGSAVESRSRATDLLRLESIYDQARATRPKHEPADAWLDAYVRGRGFQSGGAVLQQIRRLRREARRRQG